MPSFSRAIGLRLAVLPGFPPELDLSADFYDQEVTVKVPHGQKERDMRKWCHADAP